MEHREQDLRLRPRQHHGARVHALWAAVAGVVERSAAAILQPILKVKTVHRESVTTVVKRVLEDTS